MTIQAHFMSTIIAKASSTVRTRSSANQSRPRYIKAREASRGPRPVKD